MALEQGEPLNVLASIRPLHSIVSAVMGETGTPQLLVTGSASPHAFSMRPSDARKLENADIVFWSGPTLETFLINPLRTLAGDADVHALADTPGLVTRPVREGGLWEAHDHEGEDDHAHEGEEPDPHFWLDPQNGIAMANAIADLLGQADPARESTYAANARAFAKRVMALDAESQTRLRPVLDVPYIVFHDAYQYFEAHYGLSPQGSVTVASDRPAGTRRIIEIRARITGTDVRCVFAPPQFSPRLVRVLVENSSATSATLDDLGTDIEPGPQLYETMLRHMTDNFVSCLGA
jgi:zinc transport system substrate-binding protein